MRDSSTAKALPKGCAHRHGTRLAGRLARKRTQFARDEAHAVSQLGNAFGLICTVARSPRSRNRRLLPDKVRSAVRAGSVHGATPVSCPITASLPACTSSFCAAPESGFCADALLHFLLQAFVGLLQVGRALLHLALQLIVRGLQRLACGQSRTRSRWWRRRWLSMKPSSAKEGRARAGNQGA